MSTNVRIYINDVRQHRKPRWRLEVYGPVSEQHVSGPPINEVHMLASLKDTQQVDATWGSPHDLKGAVAPVESVVFQSSDETVATLVQDSTNPLKVLVVAGMPGVCQVWPTADADLGDGVKNIEGEKLDVQVTGGEAVGFGPPVLGTPVEQP